MFPGWIGTLQTFLAKRSQSVRHSEKKHHLLHVQNLINKLSSFCVAAPIRQACWGERVPQIQTLLTSTSRPALNRSQKPTLVNIWGFSPGGLTLRQSGSTSKRTASMSLACISTCSSLVLLWGALRLLHVSVGGLSFCIHVKARVSLCLDA